jgi:hypothetical protein
MAGTGSVASVGLYIETESNVEDVASVGVYLDTKSSIEQVSSVGVYLGTKSSVILSNMVGVYIEENWDASPIIVSVDGEESSIFGVVIK